MAEKSKILYTNLGFLEGDRESFEASHAGNDGTNPRTAPRRSQDGGRAGSGIGSDPDRGAGPVGLAASRRPGRAAGKPPWAEHAVARVRRDCPGRAALLPGLRPHAHPAASRLGAANAYGGVRLHHARSPTRRAARQGASARTPRGPGCRCERPAQRARRPDYRNSGKWRLRHPEPWLPTRRRDHRPPRSVQRPREPAERVRGRDGYQVLRTVQARAVLLRNYRRGGPGRPAAPLTNSAHASDDWRSDVYQRPGAPAGAILLRPRRAERRDSYAFGSRRL